MANLMTRKSDRIGNLTKEEELHLGELIQKYYVAQDEIAKMGDSLSAERMSALSEDLTVGWDAIERLVRANLGLVYHQARWFKRTYPSGPELEDLEQEGMIGLLVAVEKYDPKRGNKFSTVAHSWIRQSIARGTNKTGRMIRLPENKINDMFKMNKIVSREIHASSGAVSQNEIDEKIISEINFTRQDLMNVRLAGTSCVSLSRPVSSGGAKELIEYVGENYTYPSSENAVIENEMSAILRSKITSLSPEHRDVVYAAFSLGDQPMSAKEVQIKHSFSADRYREIQMEAMTEIRNSLDEEGLSLNDFLGE